ncbi:MAG: macro domain-containing protein [Trueperaceae bacterium]|nr:macro domain-containing protein [Trueperaceae bacterium]
MNDNILDAKTQALVNTVNTVGVMGRGIALQFRKAHPKYFRDYAIACKSGLLRVGKVHVHSTGYLDVPEYIISFPTKEHWRGSSRIRWIRDGLADLVREVNARGIRSIAIPPLGCGLGGLNWAEVEPLIREAAGQMTATSVVAYRPAGSPDPMRMRTAMPRPRMTPGRAALLAVMGRYLASGVDPFISLLEVHKLMYFLQCAGEPLRLDFARAPHGPYATNLRHVLIRLDGHMIRGYGDTGDSPTKPLATVPDAVEAAQRLLDHHPSTVAALDRVSNLVEGFEMPDALELLASTHWVLAQCNPETSDDAWREVQEWGDKGSRFDRRQYDLAANRLMQLGWVSPQRPSSPSS